MPTFPSSCPVFVFPSLVGHSGSPTLTSSPYSKRELCRCDTERQPRKLCPLLVWWLLEHTTLPDRFQGRPPGQAWEPLKTSDGIFPDLAVVGANLEILWQGSVTSVYRTSYSSPVFASAVSLLNGNLIAVGKPVLGFWNTILYLTGANAMNDITPGSNPRFNTDGFPATVDGIL